MLSRKNIIRYGLILSFGNASLALNKGSAQLPYDPASFLPTSASALAALPADVAALPLPLSR